MGQACLVWCASSNLVWVMAQTLKYFDLPCRDSDEGLDSEIFLSSSYRAEIPTKEMQLSVLDFEYFTVFELPCRDSDTRPKGPNSSKCLFSRVTVQRFRRRKCNHHFWTLNISQYMSYRAEIPTERGNM